MNKSLFAFSFEHIFVAFYYLPIPGSVVYSHGRPLIFLVFLKEIILFTEEEEVDEEGS